MSAADDKAAQIVEAVRCAAINFDNVARMYPPIGANPHFRLAKHQLDCAVAIIDGKPEPELLP